LATVNSLRRGMQEIARENLQSMGVVTARLASRDLGSVMKAFKQRSITNVAIAGRDIILNMAALLWPNKQNLLRNCLMNIGHF